MTRREADMAAPALPSASVATISARAPCLMGGTTCSYNAMLWVY
jgi:hypothetical protein